MTRAERQRRAAIVEHRQWLTAWTRWRRNCEILHARRRMYPQRYGWAWLYRR